MSNVKGKGQRLIPEELLKKLLPYTEKGIEALVDSKGNPRFIAGEGVAYATGMTALYNKWSLNGTHLMLELCGYFEDYIQSNTLLAGFELPEWILNKIVDSSIPGVVNLISYNLASNSVYLNTNVLVVKTSNALLFRQWDPISATVFGEDKINFRITCSFIIDFD